MNYIPCGTTPQQSTFEQNSSHSTSVGSAAAISDRWLSGWSEVMDFADSFAHAPFCDAVFSRKPEFV
jgi:hypothetical protein